MAKADRLLKIITLLKGRRTVITARQLAEVLETSERTIYRDIQVLLDTGFPVEGEAGVGYRLQPGFEIPPIMFTAEQLLAVQLGLKMVQGWSDKELAISAEEARVKIEAVIPERLKETNQQNCLLVSKHYLNTEAAQHSLSIRKAIQQQCYLTMAYKKADGEHSNRVLIPLGLVYWGQKWTLIAWCQLRHDYREFRLDRIQALVVESEKFSTDENINLASYLKLLRELYGEQC